ncbi:MULTISPECIES: hypothetical protein [Achromobacter]|uniref:Uncharacterized protein n=1 Tax=Achromobacter mucicolens TaxID=1389922 RepID=A0ABM8LL65_9BURK|nr:MULTISPECIES: hypothetical protein [Achromobacter]CAB3844997.1 hypothetical protein LMG3410_01465 [Achromobacter aegrifaciens]CAB3915009.1 hypothetical protein LMG3415_05185 [Achromobacter mucicolens]
MLAIKAANTCFKGVQRVLWNTVNAERLRRSRRRLATPVRREIQS